MAERRLSNVLPFEPPGAAPGVSISADAAQLLAICRDRLALGIATAFAGNLGRANDDLLGMADRATSLEQQQLSFAAMDFLASHGQALLQQFRSTYVAHFEASLGGLRRGRRLERPAELAELSLIDTEDFERDLAIDKLSARAACNCANQLTALERRLAALLQLPRVSQDDNPLYPRALFNAMLGALNALGAADHLALTLLQEFERQTSVELPGIYNELNRALVDGGVLPKIPVGLTRPTRRSDVEALTLEDDPRVTADPDRAGESGPQVQTHWTDDQPTGGVAEHGTAGYASVSGGSALSAGAEDIFALLARAINAKVGATMGPDLGAATGGPWGPVVGASPLYPAPAVATTDRATSAPAPESTLGVSQLIQALTSLQQGHTDPRDLPGLGHIQIDPKGGQALQQLRATPLVSWSHPMDALTVDIVAQLFDAIFKDPDLSAALRAEIAKLQIPVLKVALRDKTFFSNQGDPARLLLDGIASAGIGREASEESRLTDKVRTIVDEVVAGFDTDVDIFVQQLKALEDFLREEDLNARSRASQVVGELEAQDRQALARARVDAEIASRTHWRSVPTLVADFLNRHWRLVLAHAYAQGGEEGQPWLQALATMDELLWSIEPKAGPEDRARLLSILPTLLRRLRAALEALDISDAWDPFFAQLIRLHVAALHNETPEQGSLALKSKPPRPDASRAPAPGAPRDFRTLAQVDAAAGIAFRTQDPPGGAPAPSVAASLAPNPPANVAGDRHLQIVQSLDVGAWVELESVRGTRKTLRLSWVSELRGVYLFTNRQGENALTLAATSLADHLRNGTARILSQDRLTDRAVAQLLQNSEGGPPPVPG